MGKRGKYPKRTERWLTGDRRQFNGKTYHRYVVTEKARAKQHAKALRKKGWLVRLVKMAKGGYSVFRRKKR